MNLPPQHTPQHAQPPSPPTKTRRKKRRLLSEVSPLSYYKHFLLTFKVNSPTRMISILLPLVGNNTLLLPVRVPARDNLEHNNNINIHIIP